MEKIKKISKYLVNGLNMINALIVALSGVWNWNIDNISKTIIAITGVISVYLVSGKLFDTETIESDDLVSQNVEMPEYEEDDNGEV
jgi:hypothetical protein